MTERDRQQGEQEADVLSPSAPVRSGAGRGDLESALVRRLRLAGLVVFWERLWPRLWPLASWLTLGLALALLDLLPRLGPAGHIAFLALFAGIAVLLALRAVRGFTAPTRYEAARRVERASGLKHRPLTSRGDALSLGEEDTATQALWKTHRLRAEGQLARLTVGWPHAPIAGVDPLALRALPILLLVIALTLAGGQSPERLARALSPNLAWGENAEDQTLALWIDPPPYTRRAPIYLEAGAEETAMRLEAPQGSRLIAQASDDAPPLLNLGEEEVAFDALQAGGFRTERRLETPGAFDLTVETGGATSLATHLSVLPDRPPRIAFLRPPAAAERGALAIAFRGEDDHGVQDVTLEVMREGGAEDEVLAIDLPLAGRGEGQVEGSAYRDLTAHPWAGLPVRLRLIATDALEQRGESGWESLVLPERRFKHPVARELAGLRKHLAAQPLERRSVSRTLALIGLEPEAFGGDTVALLGIRAAERRLIYDLTPEAIASTQALLWETALHIEDGDLSLAERDLREAQDALMEALDRDAPAEELEALTRDLEAAMERFSEAMARQLAESGALPSQEFQSPNAESLDLNEIVNAARQLIESGAREEAMELLSQLRSMLENLERNPQMAEPSPEQRAAEEAMDALRSLAQEQQQLLDETFRNAQRSQSGPVPVERQLLDGSGLDEPPEQSAETEQSPETGQSTETGLDQTLNEALTRDAERQRALRETLSGLEEQLQQLLEESPAALDQAGEAMEEAAGALGAFLPSEAVAPQGAALDALRQGMEAAGSAMAERFGSQGQGQGIGWGLGPSRDPFGRPQGRRNSGEAYGPGFSDDGSDSRLPEEMELRRAREVLDELRRRSGERDRPLLEREYLERLLRSF